MNNALRAYTGITGPSRPVEPRPPSDAASVVGSFSMFRLARSLRPMIVGLPFTVALALSLAACSGLAAPKVSISSVPGHVTLPRSFVGVWYVHGGILTINARGTGSQVFSFGAYGEADTITFVSQDHGQRLLGVIRHIRYANSSGSIVNPDPADAQRVGDTFNVVRVNPHTLRKTYIKSALPETDRRTDNPNWCGPGLNNVPEVDRQRCGVG